MRFYLIASCSSVCGASQRVDLVGLIIRSLIQVNAARRRYYSVNEDWCVDANPRPLTCPGRPSPTRKSRPFSPQLTWLNTGQATAPDDASELGWWEAKLWRPNWTGLHAKLGRH